MDYEDEVLAELDIVIGSPHISLKQDEKKATDRMLRANRQSLREPDRPSDRPTHRRAARDCRWISPRSSPRRRTRGVALEINAGYPRLDLNDEYARAAVAAGVRPGDRHRRPFNRRLRGNVLGRGRSPPRLGNRGERNQLLARGGIARVF